jgi:hypothetical protein
MKKTIDSAIELLCFLLIGVYVVIELIENKYLKQTT